MDVTVVSTKDISCDKGLLYDLKVPNPGPQQRVLLIGRIIGDSIEVDVMNTHDGITINKFFIINNQICIQKG